MGVPSQARKYTRGSTMTKRLKSTASDHNFWTWNLSRSSKISKDWDCSLVSSKNFSEILPSKGLGPRPGEVGQGGLKVFNLWCNSQKKRSPQPQFFFYLKQIFFLNQIHLV